MAVIVNGELVETVALPDQTGHAGQALVTNGTSADWTALAGTGDMTKATYDTNNNSIVDRAASVDDGSGNIKTAAQIKTHIDSTSNPHNVTAGQIGVAATPSGTGMVHVTAGVQDGASKLVANADVDAGAAIAESKLSLNYPTHSNANDPSADQKNALVGTNGTPYSGNRYVTDSDPRNTNTRTPVAHGSAQHTGTIGTPTQVSLGNVPNVDTTNAANITSGTLPAARLPAMSAGAKGAVPATGAPSGKYLKDDGTFDTPAGAGDMLKATYDTGDNGIVDKAASVDDGAGNAKTALEVKTAIDTTIPGKATLVAGAVNGNLAGLDAGGDLTDSGNAPADFAPAAKGVTDGDSHDHTGGAGAAITESALSLSNVATGNVDDTKHGFCPITPNDTDKYLRGDGTWAIPPSGGSPPTGTGWRHVTAGVEDGAASTPSKTDVGLGNVANVDQTNPANITQDATHRFATDAEKSAWNAKLDPAGSGANLTGIPEGALSFTNITTNDVSTTKHGLTPRAPNDTTKFLRGDATWAVPSAGSASWPLITTKPEITVGDTGYATLDAILAGSPTAGTSILVPSGTHTLHASNNRTVPAGVTLKALAGARITIPSGRTFTISGNLEAGAYQIFDNSANSGDLTKGVKFSLGSISFICPEWWGMVNDTISTPAENANTAALNYALNANVANVVIPIIMGSGVYYVNDEITCGQCSALEGVGSSQSSNTLNASQINSKNSAAANVISGAYHWIKNMQFQMGSANTVGILADSSTPRAAEIEHNFIDGQYAANTDSVIKIKIASGNEQLKTRWNRLRGPGAGIQDLGDGGQTDFNEIEGSGYQTTGIFASGSPCRFNQIQYHNKGISSNTSIPLTGNMVQQNMYGIHAQASRNITVLGGVIASNFKYGIFCDGPDNLQLSGNIYFAGNWAAIGYGNGCKVNINGNIFENYINVSDIHYRTVQVVPDVLSAVTNGITSLRMYDNSGLDIPYTSNNGIIGDSVLNYYEITGLNQTFNCGYSSVAVTVTVDATYAYWTRGSGSWVTDGFVTGMDFDVTGFTDISNNSRWRITAIGGTGNNMLTTTLASQFGFTAVAEGPTAATVQGQPVLTRNSGGTGDWDTSFPVSGVLEGDIVKLGGNFAHELNTSYLLTVYRVADNALYFVIPEGGTSGISASANETATSGTVTRVPLILGNKAIIESPNSGKTISKIYNNSDGENLTLILDDANVGLAKWAEPEAAWVVTGGGVTATRITGDSSWTAFTATAAQHDAVVWVSDMLTGAIKVTTSQAFVSAGCAFTWEYLKIGGTWAALPAVSLNDPWGASPGTQEVYFSLPSDAMVGICRDYYTADAMGSLVGYLIRCRLSTAGTPSVDGTCSSVLSACWMRLSADTIAATTTGLVKNVGLQTHKNIVAQTF